MSDTENLSAKRPSRTLCFFTKYHITVCGDDKRAKSFECFEPTALGARAAVKEEVARLFNCNKKTRRVVACINMWSDSKQKWRNVFCKLYYKRPE